jgi:hypothetical protein
VTKGSSEQEPGNGMMSTIEDEWQAIHPDQTDEQLNENNTYEKDHPFNSRRNKLRRWNWYHCYQAIWR